MKTSVEAFWQAYLASLPEGVEPSSSYEAWSFCDNEEAANELGDLVKAGIKTATCSLVWEYEAEHEELPQVGDISLITNWDGDPLCIIETIEVQVKAFNEVEKEFAYDEGEGDRSLVYWRKVHWDVFSKECFVIGREPTETMPLVCERFRVVFPQ
ncbi:MAG: ASCH domain-containing protein [Anaerolineae bacterium]|nr:ASCH domain-containing protein [Anaerolineae bacterium]